ncbi:MAG TPA: cell envelope integrity protein CreD [Rhodocyclaceae bacterium]
MQKKLGFKLLVIAFLSLLLLVPLQMIESQIASRSARQNEVVRNIAESAAGSQVVIGPVLAVRYRERVEAPRRDAGEARFSVVERTLVLPPQQLDIGGAARVETRSRGLYQARLYHLAMQLTGKAAIPPHLGLDRDHDIVSAQATLVMGVSDPRGVGNDPEVRVNGAVHRLVTGTDGALGGQGMHVPLGEIDVAAGRSFDFSLPLDLTGSERLAIAPAGNATTVSLKSDWPHPSFQGRFLPIERSVTPQGFEARWKVSQLARDFDAVREASRGNPETLSVSFMDPVNVYLKSERAVKYGILFVVLTFGAFFVTEVLRRLRIHPLQYLLVGLALAIFFLLLIALSEHVAFVLAYGISAAACVALVGTYLAGVFGSRLQGAAFGAAIAALYGVLYGVLLSEDNALLMGALLLFAALGATMLATRRIDWYGAGAAAEEAR